MAIDWKTIISEFDGKPTLLQAIGKLRKAIEEETITIQEAQAEIDKLEAQQKADEAIIAAAQTTIEDALSLAQTNEQDIGVLDGEVAGLNNNKLDKSTNITVRGQVYAKDTDGTQTMFDVTTGLYPLSLVRRNFDGQIFINEATEEKNAVNFGQFTDLMRDRLKTLFGNKSIVGYGNIDLYKHNIQIQKGSGGSPSTLVFLSIISSSNLKVDSLTDLKQLLNLDDYGFYPVSGICETTGIAVTINKSQDVLKIMSVKNGNLSEYTIVDETITDTVTTI